ncbi:MAG: hypothetical protein ACR2FS_19540 [Phormidesmis sp.]
MRSIRWQKVLVVLAPIAVIGCFPLLYRWLNPDYFSGIACVRVYPDQRVEKDRGESCYDPNLPAAIVLKRG